MPRKTIASLENELISARGGIQALSKELDQIKELFPASHYSDHRTLYNRILAFKIHAEYTIGARYCDHDQEIKRLTYLLRVCLGDDILKRNDLTEEERYELASKRQNINP